MSKTLIIPDIHQDFDFVDRCFEAVPEFDECIFLGDYFDSFKGVPDVYGFRESCRKLKNLILEHPQKDKFIFLVGNHDMHYIYQNKKSGRSSVVGTTRYFCSGVTKSKISDFRREFFDKNLRDDFFFEKFKLVYRAHGWTFSHAGIIVDKIPPYRPVNEFIESDIPEAFFNFRDETRPQNYIISDVGVSRYGNAGTGGILWCDWNYDFSESSAVGKQIVGHTTCHRPAVLSPGTNKESWNLDCLQGWCAVINEGKLTEIEVKKQQKEVASETTCATF